MVFRLMPTRFGELANHEKNPIFRKDARIFNRVSQKMGSLHPILALDAAELHGGGVRLNRSTLAFLATLTIAAIVIWWVISRVDQKAAANIGQTSWQDADTPPASEILLDPWLDFPDAWSEASLPISTTIGPATNGGTEVFAVADGMVLFSGIRNQSHALILGHRHADGTRFESIYAPLAEVNRRPGDLVGRGMIVGQLGEASLRPVWREAPSGIEMVKGGTSPLAEALESPDSDSWMTLEIGNAEKILELMADPQD